MKNKVYIGRQKEVDIECINVGLAHAHPIVYKIYRYSHTTSAL